MLGKLAIRAAAPGAGSANPAKSSGQTLYNPATAGGARNPTAPTAGAGRPLSVDHGRITAGKELPTNRFGMATERSSTGMAWKNPATGKMEEWDPKNPSIKDPPQAQTFDQRLMARETPMSGSGARGVFTDPNTGQKHYSVGIGRSLPVDQNTPDSILSAYERQAAGADMRRKHKRLGLSQPAQPAATSQAATDPQAANDASLEQQAMERQQGRVDASDFYQEQLPSTVSDPLNQARQLFQRGAQAAAAAGPFAPVAAPIAAAYPTVQNWFNRFTKRGSNMSRLTSILTKAATAKGGYVADGMHRNTGENSPGGGSGAQMQTRETELTSPTTTKAIGNGLMRQSMGSKVDNANSKEAQVSGADLFRKKRPTAKSLMTRALKSIKPAE